MVTGCSRARRVAFSTFGLLAVWAGTTAGGCGGAATSEAGQGTHVATATFELASMVSSRGEVRATLYAVQPPPLSRGRLELRLRLERIDTGLPPGDVVVRMTPWMPSMGHGTATTPTFRQTDDGSFVSTDVVLPMPGLWELRVTVSGEQRDEAVFVVDVV
jgi:hypothetical protein